MTTPTLVHRAQGCSCFPARTQTPSFQLQKFTNIKYRSLMVILTTFSSSGCLCSFEAGTMEQEKAQEGKKHSAHTTIYLSFELLPSCCQVVFTSCNTLHFCNGCTTLCTYSSHQLQCFTPVLLHLSRTVCSQSAFPHFHFFCITSM